MTYFKLLAMFFVLVASISCSLALTPATAPSNPPKVNKSDFQAKMLIGQFVQFGAPKMFLWPVEKESEDGELTPLTFAEKAQIRQKISALADEASLYGQLKNEEIFKVENKFISLVDLEEIYRKEKCFSLCDPNDFFSCDVTNQCSKYNDTWKTPETVSEEQVILSCQANESERREIEEQKKQEYNQRVEPLRQKEAQASLALLSEVNRDYFRELTSFEFTYDPTLGASEQLQIFMVYGDIELSSHPAVGSGQQMVRQINFDLKGGFLSFQVDAIDLDNGNKVYGELFFDLEFGSNPESLGISGDVVLTDGTSGEQRVGRFSQSGQIRPLGAIEKVCD